MNGQSSGNEMVKSSIADLPEEMILKIFSYLKPHFLLNSVALVCKKWERISRDSSFWNTMSLNQSNLRDCSWSNIFNRFQSIQNLTLKNFSLGYLCPLTYLTLLPRLHSIELHYCVLDCVKKFKNILRPVLNEGSPSITNFSLNECYCTTEFIHHISDLNSLKRVNMQYFGTLDPHKFVQFLTKCPHIEDMRISNVYHNDTNLNTEFIIHLFHMRHDTLLRVELVINCDDEIFQHLSLCQKLECLKIFDSRPVLTDLTLLQIMNLSSLTELCLGCCDRFTSIGIHDMFNNGKLNNLNHLEIWGGSNLSDDNLYSISYCCKKLTFLALICCKLVSDDGLIFIAEKCSLLVELDVRECAEVNGQFLDNIKEKEFLVNLETLCLDERIEGLSIVGTLSQKRPNLNFIFLNEDHARIFL